MKKILGLIGTLGISLAAPLTLVSCNSAYGSDTKVVRLNLVSDTLEGVLLVESPGSDYCNQDLFERSVANMLNTEKISVAVSDLKFQYFDESQNKIDFPANGIKVHSISNLSSLNVKDDSGWDYIYFKIQANSQSKAVFGETKIIKTDVIYAGDN